MSEQSVDAFYKDLFDKDPLLLDSENQKKYCERLLNNILENRTVATSDPQHLSLTSAESRRKFERRRPDPPPRPPQAAIDSYRDAYLKRSIITPEVFKELRDVTMVCDGERTQKRVDGTYADHDAAQAELIATNARSSLASRIRIAAVGYRVSISRLTEDAMLDESLCMLGDLPEHRLSGDLHEHAGVHELGRTRARENEKRLGAWWTTIKDYLGHAHARRSHVIVFPEFALPPADSRTEAKCEKEIISLCQQAGYDHLLFSGSRHEGGYNRGLVVQVEDKQVFEEPYWHYKIASARTLGENILGPHHNKVASYPVRASLSDREVDLAVTIALCYDAFDPSTFLALVRQGKNLQEEAWPTVIVVPSFNPSEEFVAMTRDLSFVTRSVVVYVNGLHGDAKMFICGFAISDIIEKIDAIRGHIARKKEPLLEQQDALRKKFVDGYPKTVEGRQAHQNDRAAHREVMNSLEPLTDLEDALASVVDTGGLKHLITVEPCPDCGAGASRHEVIGRCERDVLYYNIDPKLLRALVLFRNDHIDDTALPYALRSVSANAGDQSAAGAG